MVYSDIVSSLAFIVSIFALIISGIVGYIECRRWKEEEKIRKPYAFLDDVESYDTSFKCTLVITNRQHRDIVIKRIYANCGQFYDVVGTKQDEYGANVVVELDEYPMKNATIPVPAYETRRFQIHLIADTPNMVGKATLMQTDESYSVAIDYV
ncbi:MAG: hypothetical protein KKA55_01760 [Proteobacteria bacterium]|nr:hypothetical protein [Pseudomonadota bacterium]MBU1594244.1 hypothetical protein [Pseudomonadota bacterium]